MAETNQRKSEALKVQLDARNIEIQKQSAIAHADLDKAVPALEAAQQAVSNIQRKHLDEIRALPKPVCQAVCMQWCALMSFACVRTAGEDSLDARSCVHDIVTEDCQTRLGRHSQIRCWVMRAMCDSAHMQRFLRSAKIDCLQHA